MSASVADVVAPAVSAAVSAAAPKRMTLKKLNPIPEKRALVDVSDTDETVAETTEVVEAVVETTEAVVETTETVDEPVERVETPKVESVEATINVMVMRGLKKMTRELTMSIVILLAAEYDFDAGKAMEFLESKGINVISSAAAAASSKGGSPRSTTNSKAPKAPRAPKAPKVAKTKSEGPSVPLPFTGTINEDKCKGIRFNHGLHTQCLNDKVGGDYCPTCQKHADKNSNGKPNHGDIRDRLECGLLEFRDPKGKLTLPLINVIQKLGLDKEKVIEEADKFNITIPEEHWEFREVKRGRPAMSDEEKAKRKAEKDAASASGGDSDGTEGSNTSTKRGRGRPKKNKDIKVDGDDEDGDEANMLMNALEGATSGAGAGAGTGAGTGAESDASDATTKSKRGRPPMSDEEKEAKKAAKEAEKAAKKAAREAERAAKKAAKEAAKEAEKEAKKAAKEAEKAAKKAAKEAEKAAPAKDEAEAKFLEEQGYVVEATETKAETNDVEAEEADEDEECLEVEEVKIDGKTYYKDTEGTLYDPETQEAVGTYDEIVAKQDTKQDVEDAEDAEDAETDLEEEDDDDEEDDEIET